MIFVEFGDRRFEREITGARLTPDEVRRACESLGEKDRAFISQYLLAKKGDGPHPAA
jgi:hypothetical protein